MGGGGGKNVTWNGKVHALIELQRSGTYRLMKSEIWS